MKVRMFGDEHKFDKYVSSQEIAIHKVYGSEHSIKLPLNEIKQKGLSRILAKYLNEGKAEMAGDCAYIVPDYDDYQIKPQNYKKRRLQSYVGNKNFVTMINGAEIVAKDEKYFLKVKQSDVQKYQCVLIAALLINVGLAKMDEQDSVLLIQYDFQSELERKTKIQSDLSHFRTLIGESNNLMTLLDVLEESNIINDKIYIEKRTIIENAFMVEMMSLCDMGIAQVEKDSIILDIQTASWLLEYVGNTSDRLSFSNLYDN